MANPSTTPELKGVHFETVELTPDDSESVLNIIPDGAKSVRCAAGVNGTDDFIVLPSLTQTRNGHSITIICNSAGMEIRTPASSNEEINSEDSDSTKEYTVPSGGQIHYFTKIDNTIGWMANGYTAIGAVVSAIIPGA